MAIQNTHVAMLSSPGIGHLIPIIELGKRLVAHHNINVTIFAAGSHKSMAESEIINLENATYPKLFNIVQLPQADISRKVNADINILERIRLMMHEALAPLRLAIVNMTNRPTVLIADFFGTEAFRLAEEFGMLKLAYLPCSAWYVSYLLYTPLLCEELEQKGLLVNRDEAVQIPGCKPLDPNNAGFLFMDRSRPDHEEHMMLPRGLLSSEGFLINTWEDIEPVTLNSLVDHNLMGRIIKKPIYAIGPIVRPASGSGSIRLKNVALDWLDNQDEDSVLYVSFGSGGMLSAEQTIELAWGLELSGHRLIWLFRPPAQDESGAYFNAGNGSNDQSSYLPDGFLTRTKNVGLMITGWAPQADILAHEAVGGFLSHCGWNSTQESFVYGKPVIAWPLFAEQTMNATLLNEEFGTAVCPREWPAKGTVMRGEIEAMVRKVMKKEGNLLRQKAIKIKQGAKETWKEGGSSYKSLSQLAEECCKWELKKENGAGTIQTSCIH